MFYKFITKILEIVVRILFRVEVVGADNIPQEGSCILAFNHKSNWDPIIVAGLLRERKINGVAKKELFKNPVLRFILNKLSVIPVNRENPDVSTIKKIMRVLREGEVLGIFPEGTRHKDRDSFADAKAGLGMFAVKGKSIVIPISIMSSYKLFSRLIIFVDEPIDLSDNYGKKLKMDDYENISECVMKKIKDNYFKVRNK